MKRNRQPQAGFTLIEMMIVVAVTVIVAGMAVPISKGFLNSVKADGSLGATIDVLTQARDQAVAQRRNFELEFNGTSHLKVWRIEVPTGYRTQIMDIPLDNGQQFKKFPSLPDTPDAFGNANAIQFSGTGPWMFTSDGSLIDSNGDVSNGTVFLGVPTDVKTARAVTVFGATGLMRTWRWRGTKWFSN
jgi:prepilin-type N-terminal cleavage/methylation domain-containing protein